MASIHGRMPAHTRAHGGRSRLAMLACILGCLATLGVPAGAAAGDRVYWSNYSNASLSFANLDGSGGGQVATTGATASGPRGVAIDSAAGRIYWINESSPKISFANLDGSGGGGHLAGATTSGASGLALDPVARRVYWGDGSTIGFARLDGTGGGNLNTTGATVSGAAGVAIDPQGGRIYWSNATGNKISFANLDGSGGGGNLPTGAATVSVPEGVALDLTARRIYWANQGATDRISFANLDGSGGGDLATTGATVAGPIGVAVDSEAGRVYWANWSPAGISYANLDGSGGGDLAIAGTTPDSATYPVLVKSPRAAGIPAVSGGSTPGSTLSCSNGAWASDLVEAFLYRGPVGFSFQWSVNGADITGATDREYTAFAPGDHRCRATASNVAGSASQTSDPHTIATPAQAPAPAPPGPAPAQPLAPAAFGASPLVTLRLQAARIPARGPLRVVIANANTFEVTGTLSGRTIARISTSATRRIALRAVAFRVPARATRTAALRLPKALQRFLARSGRVRLRLSARAKDPAGNTRTVTRAVTVRLKPTVRR